MLKKTIKFIDYFGDEREEDFYFNLSKAELMKLQLGTVGGLTERIKTIMSTKNVPAMMDLFEDIILKSYGEKSEDGRRFIKNDELAKAFSETPAYEELFMEILTEEGAAANFIKGIIPAELAKELESQEASN